MDRAQLDRLSICRAASALHDEEPSAAVDGPSASVWPRAGEAAAGSVWTRSAGRVLGFFQSPHAKPLSSLMLLKWILRLAQRLLIAQGLVLLTIAFCVLLGFPAIVTTFFVVLVDFCANMFVAVRTLGPVFRKFLVRGQ